MSNTPRRVGMLSPNYLPKLTDDSGTLVNLTGATGAMFSMTLTNTATGAVKTCAGLWTIITDPLDGIQKPSYSYQATDLDTPGTWLVNVYMQQGSITLAFDPDMMIVEP